MLIIPHTLVHFSPAGKLGRKVGLLWLLLCSLAIAAAYAMSASEASSNNPSAAMAKSRTEGV